MSVRRGIRIRDPIHGTLRFDDDELKVVDHRSFQRLRWIKQLGLADLAFPGATHTRYAHGLGTSHIATRMFDWVSRDFELLPRERRRLRTTVRLAALAHDLGHAPLSHTTESFMPPVSALGIERWALDPAGRRATHEDFTLKILTDSDLTDLIRRRFRDRDIEPEDIAALVAGRWPTDSTNRYVLGGRNWMPILRQCVSSELDADRMDYLLRDSYFAGVPYGRYDLDWLIENLVAVELGRDLHLGLNARASFGFEDYLLSRYHMFLSVYFHHVPIGYELMLARFQEEAGDELRFPASVDEFMECDDLFLYGRLKASKNPWARRIVERRGYRLLVEQKETAEGTGDVPAMDFGRLLDDLDASGIPALVHSVEGRLSKYFTPTGSRPPTAETDPQIYVLEEDGRPVPIEEYTPLYRRYAGAISIQRVYVEPDHLDRARTLIRRPLT